MEGKLKQRDDNEVLRELNKRIQSGEWANSLWTKYMEHRQFAAIPENDELANRPKLRKRIGIPSRISFP